MRLASAFTRPRERFGASAAMSFSNPVVLISGMTKTFPVNVPGEPGSGWDCIDQDAVGKTDIMFSAYLLLVIQRSSSSAVIS